MFSKAKNIDRAFKHIKYFSILIIIVCAFLTAFVVYNGYKLAAQTQQKVYILANGKALEAYSSNRKDNIPVEIRDHVRMFHHYFFTLDPDEKVIQANITKALYLADGSAKKQYDNLKENSYYSNIMAGNISQEIEVDSVYVDIDRYPFYFRCYGTQKIIRPTTIVNRNLVTEGFLRNVSRSDNNPHGFLIEKWSTLENKDIKTQTR
ncbi:MAG: conjugative transposon protein TraK [Chitinophagaceae bacterium]|nr:MAG: conjugative transposon protein TraK [Chitinophagaceae bacterium]